MISFTHSREPRRQGNFPRRSLAYGGTPRATGHVPIYRLSKPKVLMGPGCTPICTAKKAIGTMQPTGIAGRASLFAENPSMQNGAALRKTCFEVASSCAVHKMTFSGIYKGDRGLPVLFSASTNKANRPCHRFWFSFKADHQ